MLVDKYARCKTNIVALVVSVATNLSVYDKLRVLQYVDFTMFSSMRHKN